jgi:hypothetical protein
VRFAEIALFAAPFLVFVAWRLLAPSGDAPRMLVITVTVTVVTMAGLLLVLRYENAEPPDAVYVPAQQVDGKIIPGHVVPARTGER